MSTRLEASAKFKKDVNIWVDEAIWGHRFYNDQTPWLVFLEFLAIFQSRSYVGRALNESRSNDEHEKFQYNIPRLIPIRQLIFNNPHIRYVHDNYQSDPERWREWLKIFSLMMISCIYKTGLVRLPDFYMLSNFSNYSY